MRPWLAPTSVTLALALLAPARAQEPPKADAPRADAPKASPGAPESLRTKMRDGVELASDLYRPAGDAKVPTVLVRTPYGRKKLALLAQATRSAGIAVLAQDDRGRFDSAGDKLPFAGSGWGDRGDDGADTIAWIRSQPWSDGRVATWGASALGIVQNFTAAARPEGLAAQWIEVAAGDLYHEAAYVGGVFREEQAQVWTGKNQFDPKAIPLMLAHPLFDDYWRLYDTRSEHGRMNVPATHVGGWFDTFVEGTISSYRGRQLEGDAGAKGKQRLVLGPWTHGGRNRTRQGELDLPTVAAQAPGGVGDAVRFFRHHLLAEKNGVEEDAPVSYYVLGKNEWRTAKAWPPESEVRRLWLRGSGELASEAPAEVEAPRGFSHRPEKPIPTRGGRNLTIPAGPHDQRPVETLPGVVSWTSRALEAPLEIAGAVRAKVWLVPGAAEVDVHVRLSVVEESGRSLLVLDGVRRASLREGFEKAVPVEPGKPVEVTVDLGPIAWSFAKGEKLRVTVAGSNAPRWAVQPVPSDNQVLSGPETPTVLELPAVKKTWR